MSAEPEPVFIIKAKDNLALRAINFYRDICLAEGLVDQANEVKKAHIEINKWRRLYPGHCKNPDHKHIMQNKFLLNYACNDACGPGGEILEIEYRDSVK